MQKNQRSKHQHPLDYQESKSVPEKHLLLLLTTPKFIVWITINWKILQEIGIPDHITCLLRNLCADQAARVRTRHTIGCKLGKEYIKDVCCHRAYLTFM